jgi:hypothetical protein
MRFTKFGDLPSFTGRLALWATMALALALAACGGNDAAESDKSSLGLGQSTTGATVGSSDRVTASAVRSLAGSTRESKVIPSTVKSGYFVDAGTGNDANPGSAAAPWRTLARLSAVTLLSGETIFLRCGSVWRESLVLDQKQLADGSRITGYGGNCSASTKPRISGADVFSNGWSKVGNVWSRAVPAGTPKIPALFVNGARLRVAQWPNNAGVGGEYALTRAGAAASNVAIQLSAADRSLLTGKDVTNATVQVRTEPWFVETLQVSGLDATGLKLGLASTFPVQGGDGFVLQDKLWMLDAPGEFFHDAQNGRLYVYPGDAASQADLNAMLVEVTVRKVVVEVSGRSGLALSQLAVDMSGQDGVAVNHAPASILDGVDASDNIGAGVRFNLMAAPSAPSRGGTIRNGRYSRNGNAGIDVGNAPNVDVLSNTVVDTGTQQAAWSNAAIVSGDGAQVDRNIIERTAFRGILFSAFGGSKISNNVLSAYCMRLSDCAAIYTVRASDRGSSGQGASVEANQIMAATINHDGTVGGDILAGIYIDDLARHVTVRGNTLTGMPVGILLHNASDNLVEANKIWLTTDVALWASMDRSGGVDMLTGNVLRNNQLVPAASVTGAYPELPTISYAKAIRFVHAMHGTASLSSGSNVFAGNRIVAFTGRPGYVADVGSAVSSAWLNVTEWMSLNPGEAEPDGPASFATYRLTLGSELLNGGGFDSGLGNWTAWFSSFGSGGSASVVPSMSGCDQQCVSLVSGNYNDRLASPHFQMVVGAQYVISFTAAFGGMADIAHPDIARPGTPYDSFVDSKGLRSSNTTLSGRAGDKIRYEAFFNASSSDVARVNLRMATLGVPVAYDSVSLRPVTGYVVSNFRDWGAAVSAPVDASKRIDCSDLGWSAGCTVIDVDGNAVPMPSMLSAGVSKLLLWSNSPWRN